MMDVCLQVLEGNLVSETESVFQTDLTSVKSQPRLQAWVYLLAAGKGMGE